MTHGTAQHGSPTGRAASQAVAARGDDGDSRSAATAATHANVAEDGGVKEESWQIGARRLQLIWDAIVMERVRQDKLLASGKFSWSCASPDISDDRKLSILMEEVGEVAHELCEQSRDPQWRQKMRTELVQVAAVAVGWLEALDEVQS